MVTLADIAQKCNTSTATVSYVLSGRGDEKRISANMQEFIKATANEIGYGRKAQKAPVQPRIALFWPQKSVETMLPAVINGLNSAMLLDANPVSMNICPYESNYLSLQESLWISKSYDSAVIVSANMKDLQYLTARHTKIPVVIHNRILDGYSCVTANHQEAGRLAAIQAICKGKDDIGLVLNPASFVGLNLRGKAFCDTCLEYGVDVSNRIYYCENNIEDGYLLGTKMIRERNVPKVIMCVYDIVSYGIMRALNETGYSVGNEVQVLATSSSLPQFFAKSTPSMTVVDLRIEEVTQRAVRLAIDLATRRICSPTSITIEPHIIYRESSPMPTLEERQRLVI